MINSFNIEIRTIMLYSWGKPGEKIIAETKSGKLDERKRHRTSNYPRSVVERSEAYRKGFPQQFFK